MPEDAGGDAISPAQPPPRQNVHIEAKRPRAKLSNMFFKGADIAPKQQASAVGEGSHKQRRSLDVPSSSVPRRSRKTEDLSEEPLKSFSSEKMIYGPWPNVFVRFKTDCSDKTLELIQRLQDSEVACDLNYLEESQRFCFEQIRCIFLNNARDLLAKFSNADCPFDFQGSDSIVEVFSTIAKIVNDFSDLWDQYGSVCSALIVEEPKCVLPIQNVFLCFAAAFMLSIKCRTYLNILCRATRPYDEQYIKPTEEGKYTRRGMRESFGSHTGLFDRPVDDYPLPGISGLEEANEKMQEAVKRVYSLVGFANEEDEAWCELTAEERSFCVTSLCTYLDGSTRSKHAVVVLADPSANYCSTSSSYSSTLTLKLPRTDTIKCRMFGELLVKATKTQNFRTITFTSVTDIVEVVLLSDVLLLLKIDSQKASGPTCSSSSLDEKSDTDRFKKFLLCEPIPIRSRSQMQWNSKDTCEIFAWKTFQVRAIFERPESVGLDICFSKKHVRSPDEFTKCFNQCADDIISRGTVLPISSQMPQQQLDESRNTEYEETPDNSQYTVFEFPENGGIKSVNLPISKEIRILCEVEHCIPYRQSSEKNAKHWKALVPCKFRLGLRIPEGSTIGRPWFEMNMIGTEKCLFGSWIAPFSEFRLEWQHVPEKIHGDAEHQIITPARERWILIVTSSFSISPLRLDGNSYGPEENQKIMECLKIEFKSKRDAVRTLTTLQSERRYVLMKLIEDHPDSFLVRGISWLDNVPPEDIYELLHKPNAIETFRFNQAWTISTNNEKDSRRTALGPAFVTIINIGQNQALIGYSSNAFETQILRTPIDAIVTVEIKDGLPKLEVDVMKVAMVGAGRVTIRCNDVTYEFSQYEGEEHCKIFVQSLDSILAGVTQAALRKVVENERFVYITVEETIFSPEVEDFAESVAIAAEGILSDPIQQFKSLEGMGSWNDNIKWKEISSFKAFERQMLFFGGENHIDKALELL
ncbi:hypothetical protein HDU67_007970 [Dinochytrium kinnereticum]|nr:hypothetical protein HDU67_007970 [Dinochytrium kinnereticum]